MKLEEIIAMWRKILTISEKPEPDEYRTLLKIVFSGLLLVGVIGFFIHYVLVYIQGVSFG